MTETGSFYDVALLHRLRHLGKAPHAPQLAELTPELADLKCMLDGMMASSMPVIVHDAETRSFDCDLGPIPVPCKA